MKMLTIFFLLFFIFDGCQESATGNKDFSENGAISSLKYPLKTGQKAAFVYQDVNTNPTTYYLDDGDYKKQKGYDREFIKLKDGTVYNANYNLFWEDTNPPLEHNISIAKNYCSELNISGNDNWRLPNVYELFTLLDLGSRTDMREPVFENMPSGSYYSSNEVYGTGKTIVVNFGEHDFNVTKAYKAYIVDKNDTNQTTSEYGVKYATISTPTYDRLNTYIIKVVVSDLYYNLDTHYKTTVNTDTLFDSNGTIINIFGPYVSSVEVIRFNPIVKDPPATYVKCVSGPQIGGFDFVRDDKNEVVLDRKTLLMWQDNRAVVQNNHRWGEALKYCQELQLAGYKDWRLPTISELVTLNDFTNAGTYTVSNKFLYKSANKFHTSSNSCFFKPDDPTCYQKNYQINTCGFLEDKVTENFNIDINPYYDNNEPYYKTRCVRGGAY